MIDLVESPRVRQYELTYLVPVSLTSSESTQAHQAVKDFIKKHGGSVTAEEAWGKKDLAYAIRYASSDLREAVYTYLEIEMPTAGVQGLDREIELHPHIIRHLLVLAEEESKTSHVAAENTAE